MYKPVYLEKVRQLVDSVLSKFLEATEKGLEDKWARSQEICFWILTLTRRINLVKWLHLSEPAFSYLSDKNENISQGC